MTKKKENRLQAIQKLLSDGEPVSEIAKDLAIQWDISERMVWNYISQAREYSEENEISGELYERFDAFQEADDKYSVWQSTQFVGENVYNPPGGYESEWNEFIRYGWGRQERINQVVSKSETGLDKLDLYCEGVRDGVIDACKWVKKAVDRHYEDLEKQSDPDFPYYFEPQAALHYIKFFEHKLSHHTGVMSGEPILFEPWQWFSYGSSFGWLKKERFRGYPLRRFKTIFIFIPKKNGKSLISGGTGLYMMDYDGWPGAQCFIIATSQSHAMELGYRDATIMVNKNESLSEKYTVNKSAANMGVYYSVNNSYYKPITSKEDSEDGKNVHYCGPDETKDLLDHGIYNLMEEGMISAPNGMMMNTTTAGFNTDSLGYSQQEYLEDVLSGIIQDDTVFGVIYGIDEKDKETDGWQYNLDLYKKANPNYGVSVFEDALISKFSKAKASPEKRISLTTKHLNDWSSSSTGFIESDAWKKCGLKEVKGNNVEKILHEYQGQKAWAGLDLGSVDDFTAFILVIESEKWEVVPMFWMPEDTISDRKNSAVIRGMLDWIDTTPGNVTHEDYIEEQIKKCAEIVNLQEIVYDRYKMNQMVNHLMDEDIEMTPFGQGYVSMSPAVDCLETAVLKGNIEHFNNPVLEWMMSNVTIKKDPAGNRKFDKEKSQDKIDGVVALAMAIARAEYGDAEGVMEWSEFKTV